MIIISLYFRSIKSEKSGKKKKPSPNIVVNGLMTYLAGSTKKGNSEMVFNFHFVLLLLFLLNGKLTKNNN